MNARKLTIEQLGKAFRRVADDLPAVGEDIKEGIFRRTRVALRELLDRIPRRTGRAARGFRAIPGGAGKPSNFVWKAINPVNHVDYVDKSLERGRSKGAPRGVFGPVFEKMDRIADLAIRAALKRLDP